MRLFHGTTSDVLESILTNGIKMSSDENRGLCVHFMDSLEKAKKVAGYFGPKGIVLEVDLPEDELEFHPDYGYGPEFDTIKYRHNIDPSEIIKIYQTPKHNAKHIRPTNMSLRDWKSTLTQKERREVDECFHIANYPNIIAESMDQ